MTIDSLNIQNISISSQEILLTSSTEINSNGPIELDFAGVQLLAYCHEKLNKKIKIQLTASSIALLTKSGFANFINDEYLILK